MQSKSRVNDKNLDLPFAYQNSLLSTFSGCGDGGWRILSLPADPGGWSWMNIDLLCNNIDLRCFLSRFKFIKFMWQSASRAINFAHVCHSLDLLFIDTVFTLRFDSLTFALIVIDSRVSRIHLRKVHEVLWLINETKCGSTLCSIGFVTWISF